MGPALEDVLVIDLTSEFYASLAGALLGDFGANVIRIEDASNPRPVTFDRDGMHPPERWDSLRELCQRNKRSIALDLSNAEGRALFEQLIAKADVFLTDVSFPDAERQALRYEDLCGVKPDLVYTRGSGFGPKGPDRDLPARHGEPASTGTAAGLLGNRPDADLGDAGLRHRHGALPPR